MLNSSGDIQRVAYTSDTENNNNNNNNNNVKNGKSSLDKEEAAVQYSSNAKGVLAQVLN